MRYVLAGILYFAVFVLVLGPAPVSAQGEADAVADSGVFFAMDLYARLKDAPGNLVFSPYSLSTALTMTYAGAREGTALEMAQALRITLPGDALHRAFAEHMKGLSSPEGYELAVANSLWGQEGHAFLPEFTALIQRYYGGDLEQVDFAQRAAAAARINAWVADKTGGKIRDVISLESVNDFTRLVLVNAVYFKGFWVKPFRKIDTQNQRFHLNPRDSKLVAMMGQQGVFLYTEDDTAQVLELPYAPGDLSMLIVLPRQIDGLAGVEAALDAGRYKGWMAALTDTEVDVTLPKFKTTAALDLAGVMSAMGMPGTFSEAADFSGMSDDPRGLWISGIFHKAFIDVSEDGTEAAAATAIDMMRQAITPQDPGPLTVAFRADHPFFYLVRDRRTDTILFMGRVMDPEVGPRVIGDVLSGMWSEVVGQALKVQKDVLSEKQGPGNAGSQGF